MQKTPTMMLPSEAKAETIPATFEADSISGIAKSPIVADRSTVDFRACKSMARRPPAGDGTHNEEKIGVFAHEPLYIPLPILPHAC
jgi:hypothetical protein